MLNKKFSKYVFALSILFLFFGCSDSTEPEERETELIPLEVGNTWIYNLTSSDTNGVDLYTDIETTTISKDTLIDNKVWYTYNYIPSSIWFTNNSGGFWGFYKGNLLPSGIDSLILIYKYPTFEGDIYGNSYTPTEVVSVSEKITVPAGEFTVVHTVTSFPVKDNYLLHSHEEFTAPGIGIIKTLQFGKKANGEKVIVYKRELLSYMLK